MLYPMLKQFEVRADRHTGEWVSPLVYTGFVLESVWRDRVDTEYESYETHEIDDVEDGDCIAVTVIYE